MAFQNSRELGGFWQVVATAAPGHSLEELQQAIDEELARLVAEGPTPDEMERGHAQVEAQFVYRLQTLGGFGGKADQLNAYSVFLNDPGYFERDLARYEGVTADDLHRAARQISPQRQSRGAERRAAEASCPSPCRIRRPRWSHDARGSHAPSCRWSAAVGSLSPRVTRIDCRIDWPSGRPSTAACPSSRSCSCCPSGRRPISKATKGSAAITADMMDEGTGSLSAIDVNAAFARIGAHLDADVSADATVFTVTALARFARQALSLHRRLRDSTAAGRRRFRPHTAAPADEARADSRHAVGDCGSRNHAGRLRRAPLRTHGARHRGIAAPAEHRDGEAVPLVVCTARRTPRWWRPATSTPRDFRQMAADIVRNVDRQPASHTWRMPPSRRRRWPRRIGSCWSTRPAPRRAKIRIGEVGLARDTPDYHPLIVLNMILGGQFVSRINMKLRQEKGLTYGARTAFDFRRGSGPFILQTSVQSDGTAEAIARVPTGDSRDSDRSSADGGRG